LFFWEEQAMNVYEELKYRGLVKDVSDDDGLTKLLDTPQTIYCGFDPSASSMHLGNFVAISLLMRLQRAGHRVIAVVGGATGMIGDPSGKSKERNLQTKETLSANTASIRGQLERFIDLTDPQKGVLINNHDWHGSFSMLDFLRDYGKYFTINYMLSKDVVASRLEAGISFTEFSYMILQSVDFLTLFERYGCRVQVGGSDQWGNLTAGLELIRKIKGEQERLAVFTTPLIMMSDGRKFGKSEEGALFLDPKLTSPYKLYQYFINTGDEDAIRYMKVFTFLTKDDIETLAKEHSKEPHLRLAQKKLAYEVVKTIHGEEAAQEAIAITEILFNGAIARLSENQIVDALGSLQTIVPHTINLVDLLVLVKAAGSKREAREFVLGRSVSLNGTIVTGLDMTVSAATGLFGKYNVIRRGKKNYYLAVHE